MQLISKLLTEVEILKTTLITHMRYLQLIKHVTTVGATNQGRCTHKYG